MIGIQQHPAFRMIEDLFDQFGVQCMPRPISNQVPDKGETEKREVANQVQDFVANELVRKPEPRFIEDAVLGEDNGIVEIPATT